MAKLSKQVIYGVLGAIALGVVAFVYTEPEAVGKKSARARTSSRSAKKDDASLITEEDLKARFPRYSQAARDVFQPGVTTGKKAASVARKSPPAPRVAPLILPPPKPAPPEVNLDTWTLTGVSTIDGVKTALIENKTSGDTVFVKSGSLWKGLRVAGIETGALVFIEPGGKTRRLTFPTPPEEKVARTRPDSPSERADPSQPNIPPPPRVPRGATVAGTTGPATENGAQP